MINFRKNEQDYWASISDLMSGLMLIFLLIAIAYMYNIAEGQKKVKEIAVTYQKTQVALYERLLEEFKNDLPKWKATLDEKTMSIRFFEPEVLFKLGKSEVNPKFKDILDDFFPRYLNIIFSDEFKGHIEEVRIEGHTSSEWNNSTLSSDEAYFENMKLSQLRAFNVLKYCDETIKTNEHRNLMKKLVTANGLSSSKPILDEKNGSENKRDSRRVEFRTKTNAEHKIVQIIEEL